MLYFLLESGFELLLNQWAAEGATVPGPLSSTAVVHVTFQSVARSENTSENHRGAPELPPNV